MSQAEISQQTQEWQERGVDIARLSGALAAAIAGGDAADVNAGSDAGGTAAANNALCGGLCIAGAIAVIYAASQGRGNPIEGLRVIGRGEDGLTQAIDSVFETATDGLGYVAAEYMPDVTEAAAGYIILGGETLKDTIILIDEASGKSISTTYDKIPVEAREIIAGVVMTGSYAAGGTGAVTKIAPNVASKLGIASTGGVATTSGLVGKLPYDARTWRKYYEDFYSGNVDSTTVPPLSAKNVKLAGQKHPVSGIVFDQRGFPIFDDVTAYDTRLSVSDFNSVDYQGQMRMATRDLRDYLQRAPNAAAQFKPDQLQAIQSGKAKIPNFTWHHHQDSGRMQLVPTRVHQKTGHVGGEFIR